MVERCLHPLSKIAMLTVMTGSAAYIRQPFEAAADRRQSILQDASPR